MKRILLLLGLAFLPSCLFAGEEETLMFMDIQTIVGVSKKQEKSSQVPMSVYTITREEIQRWGVQELYEVLGRVPGYSFYDLDFFGTEGVAVRGLRQIWRVGYSYELLPIFDWGHQVFTPNFYKNIEVARGPAGLAWGSAGEAGLININFRDDLEGSEITAQAGDGGRQMYSYAYGHKMKADSKEGRIFVGYMNEKQGYKETAAGSIYGDSLAVWRSYGKGAGTYSLNAVYDLSPFKLTVVRQKKESIARFAVIAAGNDALSRRIFERLGSVEQATQNFETTAYRLELNAVKNDKLNMIFYHNYTDKLFWVESVFQSRQIQKDFGFNGDYTLQPDKISFNFGGDLLTEYSSNAPGWQSTWARTEFGYTGRDNGTFSGQKVQDIEPPSRNLFLQGKYIANNKLQFVLGGRVDYKKNWDPEYLSSGPRFAAIYEASSMLTMKYIYNNSSRRPQANELYNKTPGLRAENLVANEAVAIWNVRDNLKIDTTLVYQKLSDMITAGNVAATLTKYFNGGELTTSGLEWAVNYMPYKKLLVYWNGSAYNLNMVGSAYYKAPAFADGSPLYIPAVTSFIGGEVQPIDFVKLNVALRTYANIPYYDLASAECKQSVSFVDFTARTKKFLNNSTELSLIALNALDTDTGVPLWGEHAGLAKGLLPAKERRVMVQATYSF